MLDPQGKDDIKNVIMQLHKESKITIISITHDIEEVVKSDNVIVLNKGKIIMEGLPNEVMINKDVLLNIGLDIPFSYKVVEKFKDNNIKLSNEVTMEGLVNELANLI